jgi:hypothetical protein
LITSKPWVLKRIGGEGALRIDLLAHFRREAMLISTKEKSVFRKVGDVMTSGVEDDEGGSAD